MKVFVSTPCAELSRYPEFWGSLLKQKLPAGVEMVPEQMRGTYISENQNNLARQFLTTDCTHYWLTNDDQVYPPDTLARLLARDVDIVAPVCVQRNAPFRPLVYDMDDGGENGAIRPLWLTRKVKGLVPIVAAGGGGTLIKRAVLEKIADPWWEVKTVRKPGHPPNQMSEDIDFARKARAAGFKLWCDADCIVGHQGVVTWWPIRNPQTGEWATAIDRNGVSFQTAAALA